MDPYEALAELVIDAPGRAAADSALTTLRQMATYGSSEAADALGSTVAQELGLAADAPLAKLYAAGFLPARLLDELPAWVEVARAVARDTDVTPLQRLIRRRAPIEDDALRAYVLAAFVAMTGAPVMGEDLGGPGRLHILDAIAGTRVVDGDNANHSFEFGRDFLLGHVNLSSLWGVIGHELGHHVFELTMGSGGPSAALTLGAATWDLLRTELPGLLEAARLGEGPPGPGDPRIRHPDAGLWMNCTAEQAPGGSWVHLSFSDRGGPIGLSQSVQLAHAVAHGLGADPVAVVLSTRGLLHLGLAGLPQDATPGLLSELGGSADSATEADTWFRNLLEQGRVSARDDVSMAALLGLAQDQTSVFASAGESALEGQAVCDAVEAGAGLPTAPREQVTGLLRLAVRCGRPDSVRLLAHHALHTVGLIPTAPTATVLGAVDPGLEGLGAYCVLIQSEEGIQLLGGDCAALWDTLIVLTEAGFTLHGRISADGQTLLANAAQRSATLVLRLLEAGADVDARDLTGLTALHHAARAGNLDVVRVLLAAGADVDAGGDLGDTALHMAARTRARAGACEVLEALLDAGADVDEETDAGATALMLAVEQGDPEVVATLLRHHADASLEDRHGDTALDRARAQHPALTDLLEAALSEGSPPP